MGLLNGIPALQHNAVPGSTDSLRQRVDASAANAVPGAVTYTAPVGHGFVAGQRIFTQGFSINVSVGSPVVVTSVTATEIVATVPGSGTGLLGTGTILSATGMSLLLYMPWIFTALDGSARSSRLVEHEGDAGWAFQLFPPDGAHRTSRRGSHPAHAELEPVFPGGCVSPGGRRRKDG